MSVFRNVVLNFKSEDDCENYIERYKPFMDTFEGTGLQSFYLWELTPESLLIFAMLDPEENAKKLLDKAGEWREVKRFEFHDQMVLVGKIEKSCNFISWSSSCIRIQPNWKIV